LSNFSLSSTFRQSLIPLRKPFTSSFKPYDFLVDLTFLRGTSHNYIVLPFSFFSSSISCSASSPPDGPCRSKNTLSRARMSYVFFILPLPLLSDFVTVDSSSFRVRLSEGSYSSIFFRSWDLISFLRTRRRSGFLTQFFGRLALRV